MNFNIRAIVASLLVSCSAASAAVIFTDVPDITTQMTPTHRYLWIQLGLNGSPSQAANSGDAVPGFQFVVHWAGAEGRDYASVPGMPNGVWMNGVGSGAAAALSEGFTLGDAGSRWGGSINMNDFIGGTTAYLGLRARVTPGGEYVYGYAQLTRQLDGNITLHGLAYESTPGVPIVTAPVTSAIPEPSSAAALAGVCVLGMVGLRRRRRS